MTRALRTLVGIHVHAQPAGLHATLASLRHSDDPPFDVLLLPDDPDAQTATALACLDLPCSYGLPPHGPPACLNRLAKHPADVVVLLESGCVAGRGWLAALLAALASDRRIGLAGPSTNLAWNEQAVFRRHGGTPAAVAATAAAARERYGSQVRSLAPLHGLADFCVAIKREVLERVGGADEGFGLGPCWEMEYTARALRAGFGSVWACGAYVHRAPFTPRRAREEGARLEASKRRYQDAVCALRLTGARADYEPHCRGDVCEHFAPATLMRIHRPLEPATTTRRPARPLASCIMPTRDRADFVLHAIELLRRQDHDCWELMIVDDGSDGLEARLPPDPRLRYLRSEPGESIGAKRNRAVTAARGDYVVHWDDDDWYAPERLRRQLAPLLAGEADITALRAGTLLDLDGWACWRVTPELHKRLFVEDVHGGTLAYRRSVWETTHFRTISLAEDAGFLRSALQRGARLARLDNDGTFVYVRHAAGAWRFRCGHHVDPRGWRRAPEPPLPPADRRFLAARSAAAPAQAGPLVSAIMPTADRRAMVQRALAYFLRQDHPARELIVLDDGEDRVADLMPDDPRVRYVAHDRRVTLGAKRNIACELARGDVIVHWDDDDWAAPHRLRYQLEELQGAGADVSGSARLLYLDPAARASWLFTYPRDRRPWLAGNTLCYTADAWRRAPFTEITIGEDARFVAAAGRRVHATGDHRFLVGIVHPSNTSPKRTSSSWWARVPVEEVERVLGDDASAYLGAV